MKGFSFTKAHDYPYNPFLNRISVLYKKKKERERERKINKCGKVKMTKLAIKRVCHIQASLYT